LPHPMNSDAEDEEIRATALHLWFAAVVATADAAEFIF
jgi:hypothetical protein